MLPVWRGDFGVDLFFVLSGFLIGGMLLSEQERNGDIGLPLFYARRLYRLWPALLFIVVLDQVTDDPWKGMAWTNAVYVNDFVPIGITTLAWTWSLAIEEQFYLVCPWLLRALATLGPRARVRALLALVVAFVGVAAGVVVAYDIRPSDAEIVAIFDLERWGYAFDVFYDKPWMRAGALLAGVIAAMVYRSPAAMRRIAQAGVWGGLVVVAALATMVLATHWQLVATASRPLQVAYLASFRTLFAAGAAVVLVACVSEHPLGRLMARPLGSRWLYPIAQLAYSAYLINPMATMGVGHLLRGVTARSAHPIWILAPCDVAATFAAAALMHLLIERPGMVLRPTSAPRLEAAASSGDPAQ
jgi:peptidoglycan/LPS O-acetylase OafA/YrhL